MAATITGVVVAYWPDRFENVQTLVKNLLLEEALDEVLVINNNPDHFLEVDGATVINCSGNFTSRSKYAVALLRPSDYYLLVDDDVIDLPGMLNVFLQYAKPGYCLCTHGQKMTSNIYLEGTMVRDVDITEPTPVDSFVGMLQFVSYGSIIKMLEAEEKIRLPLGSDWRYVAEDIFIAMANRPKALIVPREETKDCHWNVMLPDREAGDEAMQFDHGYFTMRNVFAYKAWRAVGGKKFPGPVPGNSSDMKQIEEYLQILKDRDNGKS